MSVEHLLFACLIWKAPPPFHIQTFLHGNSRCDELEGKTQLTRQSMFDPSPMVTSFGKGLKEQVHEYKPLKWISSVGWPVSVLEVGYRDQICRGSCSSLSSRRASCFLGAFCWAHLTGRRPLGRTRARWRHYISPPVWEHPGIPVGRTGKRCWGKGCVDYLEPAVIATWLQISGRKWIDGT